MVRSSGTPLLKRRNVPEKKTAPSTTIPLTSLRKSEQGVRKEVASYVGLT